MAEPAKRTRFSADDVIDMLQDVSDDDYDSDNDDECAGEVICDGSDIEFPDFDTADVDAEEYPSDLEDEKYVKFSHFQYKI